MPLSFFIVGPIRYKPKHHNYKRRNQSLPSRLGLLLPQERAKENPPEKEPVKRDHPNKRRTNVAMCDIRFAQSVMESIASLDRSLLFDQLYVGWKRVTSSEDDVLNDADAVLVEKEDIDLSVLARDVSLFIHTDR